MIIVPHARALKDYIDQPLTTTQLLCINRSELERFLDISMDRQWIHDAGQTDRPVIPGNLLLAKIPFLLQHTYRVTEFERCITVKYETITFKEPAFTGDELSLLTRLLKVRSQKDSTYVLQRCELVRTADTTLIMALEVVDIYQ